MFLELLDSDYFKLQTMNENLVKAIKKLFEDDVIDVNTKIKNEDID